MPPDPPRSILVYVHGQLRAARAAPIPTLYVYMPPPPFFKYQKMLNLGIQASVVSFIADSFLQFPPPPLYPPSLMLASLKMSVELWMSLWTGHWVVETVLISTSSLISITSNAPNTPYGGLLNVFIASVKHKLTGFHADYEYITVHGVNCGRQEGSESEPLTITPQGRCISGHCMINWGKCKWFSCKWKESLSMCTLSATYHWQFYMTTCAHHIWYRGSKLMIRAGASIWVFQYSIKT